MLTSRAITLFHSLLLLKYQCSLKYTFLEFAVDHVDKEKTGHKVQQCDWRYEVEVADPKNTILM